MNDIKLTTIRLFVAFLSSFAMTLQTPAAPGDLDLSFGSGGKVFTTITPQRDYVRRVRLQPDGKIVTLGCSISANFFPSSLFMTRHNADGTIDTSFGTNGVVTNISGFLTDFIILPDGKIMVTGSGISIYRLNSNGALDTSFGTNGRVTTNLGAGYADGRKILRQPDGKIIVVGVSRDYYGLVVLRFHADGRLDNSFGTNGIFSGIGFSADYWLIFAEAAFESIGEAIIQPDGKLLIAGSLNFDVAVLRLNSNGTFDGSFGTGGILSTDIGRNGNYTPNYVGGMALQADGKIVINGQNLGIYEYGIDSSFIWRLNGNGTTDNGFGENGVVFINEAQEISRGLASALALQPDGKILTAGMKNGVFAVSRYQPNGTIDSAFGASGVVTTPFGGNTGTGFDTIFSAVLQPDGKLVVAGSVMNSAGSHELGLARYQTESPALRSNYDFDGDGRADLSVFRESDATWHFSSSQTGFSSVPFGLGADKIVPADYDGDGKTDIAVFREGAWAIRRSSDNTNSFFLFGQAGDVPATGDYDGDGKSDIAVYRSSTSVWYIRQSSDGAIVSRVFGAGGNTDKIVSGDYDGDGKTDLAVFRSSTSVWYWLGSSNGIVSATPFGDPTDKPVPADYDGDGKTDVAVFRPANGVWHIRQSASNSLQAVSWGLATDALVPADYDGDGKADIAVYRGGVWHIRQSSGGSNYVYFGLSADVPANQIR